LPDFDIRLNLNPALDVRSLNVLVRALKDSLGPLGKDIKLIDTKKLQDELATLRKEYQDTLKNLPSEFPVPLPDIPTNLPGTTAAAFKFNQVYDALTNISQVVGTLSRPFVELDTQVKNIGTLGVKNFEEFSGHALDLSKRIPDSAANIAGGVYDAISAGITGTNEQIMKFVETAARVGVAGVSDTKSAVNGLTSIMNAYGKSVDQVGQVSNVFFAGIKLGKTTFAELNQSLANVIPAASAAGISFEEVIAMISQMTSLGVPTAQATTQIRQAIIELQKPGADLAAIMAQVGLDSSNVGKALKEKGLLSVLQQVEGAATKSGKSLTQVFSSSEASSAALLVTGQNAKRAVDTLNGVIDEAASGVGDKAYEVAATGIEARTKVMINKIQASIAKVFDTLGGGFTAALGAAAQLAPTLASVVNLKSIIPPSAITKVSGLVSTNLLPSLAKIAPALFTANAAGATSFVGLSTAAKAAWAAVTGPVGLVIAGIGLVVAAISYWLTKTKEGQRVWSYITTAVQQFWDTVKPVLEQLGSILSSVGELVFEFLVAPFQIYNEIASEIVMTIADFIAEMVGASDGAELFAMVIDKVSKFLIMAKASIHGTIEALKAFKGGVGDVLKAMLSGDVIGAATAATKLGHDVNKAYSKGISESLDENAVDMMTKAMTEAKDIKIKIDAQVEIGNLTADYEKAQQEVERITSQLLSARQSGADNATISNLEAQLGAAQGKADNLAQTLAEKVPSSVKGMKQVVDTTGRLKTVYDLNVDSLKEFTEANKKAFGIQVDARQKAFLSGLMAQQRQIARNETEMKSLSEQIINGTKAGRNVEALTTKYAKLSDETNTARSALKKSFEDAAASGLVTEAHVQQIAKALGISVDEARQLVTTQKAFTSEASNSTRSIDELGKAFTEAKKKANDAKTSAVQAAAQLASEGKRGTKEWRDAVKAGREAEQQRKRFAADEKQATIAIEGDGKSTLQRAKERIAARKTEIDQSVKLSEEAVRGYVIEQQREMTSRDELAIADAKLKASQDYLAVVKDTRSESSALVKSNGALRISIDTPDGAEAKRIIDDAQLEVQQAANAVKAIQLRIGLDDKAFENARKEFALQQLQFDITIGVRTPADLVGFYESELQRVQAIISTASEETKLELQKRELDLQKNILDAKLAAFDAEKVLNEKRIQAGKEVAARIVDEQMKLTERLRNAQDRSLNRSIDSEESIKLDAIEKLHERELISDEEYERRKTEITTKAERDRATLQNRLAGQKRVDQDILDIKSLEDQRKVLETELNRALLINPDNPEAEIIRQKLEAVKLAIQSKGSLIGEAFSELGAGIGEGMGGMFEGDPEAMQNSMRAAIANIVGMLERQIQLMAVQLLFSSGTMAWLGALPFPLNVASIPIAYGIINGAISALVRPILSAVTSFGTGGRVDNPTLAVVGDAAGANRNTEWIFRDAEIRDIVAMTVASMAQPMLARLDVLAAKLDVLAHTRTIATGDQLVVVTGRASAAQARRVRT